MEDKENPLPEEVISEEKSEKTIIKSEKMEKIKNPLRKLIGAIHYNLNKDLEISKGQFITLFLIFICAASIITSNLFLGVENTGERGLTLGQNLLLFLEIGISIELGLFVGGYLMDRIRGKRYKFLFVVLGISIIMTLFHILVFRRTGGIYDIFFVGNSFIAGVLIMFFFTFFIDFTTILERGRIFAYLIIFLGISIGIIAVVVFTIAGLVILPGIIAVFSILYFHERPEKEEPYKPIKKEETEKEIDINVLKYVFLLNIFFLSMGLLFPTNQILSLSTANMSDILLLIALILAILFAILTAIIVGSVFDFLGSKASLSNIILVIGVANFIGLFNITIKYFDIVIIVIVILAAIMSVPLIISDITTKDKIGKTIGITFSLNLFFLVLGLILSYYVPKFPGFPDEYTGEIFLLGLINFLLIISLFLLVNSKEFTSPKEQKWPENLLRLYVIHESGLLLYDYTFAEAEKDLVDSDLISGGFIGLIGMLEEITKEAQRLRIIDHGGKKILFGYNSNKSMIIALVITEELRVIRHKLDYFIQDIENKYPVDHDMGGGVNVGLWKERIQPLLEKHFTRKYFEMIPDYFNISIK